MLCEVTFVKLSVTSQKQYHTDCFLLGQFKKYLLHSLSKAVVLVTRGTVIKFQRGARALFMRSATWNVWSIN